jgi:hypothetical protein
MAKPFASSADLAEKRPTLAELAPGVVAPTAEGLAQPAERGDDALLAFDARARRRRSHVGGSTSCTG